MVQKGNHGYAWFEDLTYNQQTITAAAITTYVEETTSVKKIK